MEFVEEETTLINDPLFSGEDCKGDCNNGYKMKRKKTSDKAI